MNFADNIYLQNILFNKFLETVNYGFFEHDLPYDNC